MAPIVVANALWSSGNQMDAVLAGAYILNGWPMAAMVCPMNTNTNCHVFERLSIVLQKQHLKKLLMLLLLLRFGIFC